MSTDVLPRNPALHRRTLNGPTMGSRWSAVFYAADDFDLVALGAALQETVDRVDRQMSTWNPASDLNRLNATPAGEWVTIPRELATVLATALEIGRASSGAFDIGVGDLVQAWGFGGGSRVPDPSQIATVAGRASFNPPKTLQLDLGSFRARKLAPLMLDLSGIAKGFGVDELARVMGGFGVESWLVGIDGEMRAGGPKPDRRLWAVARERPIAGTREIDGILELQDAAVATSGNYRHGAEIDGRRVSHTMDPRTGSPLANDVAAVTVLAESCMVADAWATALMVSGIHGGVELARHCGLVAWFVRSDGEVLSAFA
ncbi:thiamine biosynthesis lipoprotein [Microvirga flocculans]|uniref:FAD:protein FMN transferase n=1 Tax=Microvirga flocculans TaxID=217168 RepID=A0A7W6IGH1_9HYPH|nr:thiamine biosynthesis lipoprotein [Microvirga flocculans]